MVFKDITGGFGTSSVQEEQEYQLFWLLQAFS